VTEPPDTYALLDTRSLTPAERRTLRRRLAGPWTLIFGFAAIIALGTLLLKLPWAAAPGRTISWSDAFFTATSAVTVTGLVVRATAVDFSFFGQLLILALLQVGGVGFITGAVLLYRLVGRRVTLGTRMLAQQDIGATQGRDVVRLALSVLVITAAIESGGALLLFLRWQMELPAAEALWLAVFQAVSTYCNAGFELFTGTARPVLYGFQRDWYTLAVLSALIILGGFGVTIYYDLLTYSRSRLLALNTRLVLLMSAILIPLGTALLLIDPLLHDTVAHNMAAHERVAVSLFTSIAARTAGLQILPLENLSEASQFTLLVLMFMGGSPASMAGGISVTAVAVLVTSLVATAAGRRDAVAFGRTLPDETIAKAIAVATISVLVVIALSYALTYHFSGELLPHTFEVVSAFSNTGYTLGTTPRLDGFGRFLIAFTMFWGRLGPLTIVVALAQREQPRLVKYPEEAVPLG
jgi:trk system potassium uptake protein TrkH